MNWKTKKLFQVFYYLLWIKIWFEIFNIKMRRPMDNFWLLARTGEMYLLETLISNSAWTIEFERREKWRFIMISFISVPQFKIKKTLVRNVFERDNFFTLSKKSLIFWIFLENGNNLYCIKLIPSLKITG